jgi:hypothetical protein
MVAEGLDLDRDEFEEYRERVKERVKRNCGSIPMCPACAVRGLCFSGEANFVSMRVRESIIGLESHKVGTAHEDVEMKCPECQCHLHFGFAIPYSEAQESIEFLDGKHFNVAHDLCPGDGRDEQLEALGYL